MAIAFFDDVEKMWCDAAAARTLRDRGWVEKRGCDAAAQPLRDRIRSAGKQMIRSFYPAATKTKQCHCERSAATCLRRLRWDEGAIARSDRKYNITSSTEVAVGESTGGHRPHQLQTIIER